MALRTLLVVLSSFVVAFNAQAQAPPIGNTDSLGDPLPAGAIARLGTLRFKHEPGSSGSLRKIIFSPDGKKILSLGNFQGQSSGSTQLSLRLCDSRTGKAVAGPWKPHVTREDNFIAAAFSPNGMLIAAVGPKFVKSENGTVPSYSGSRITLWDHARAKAVRIINAEPRSLWTIAFSEDGKTLVTASRTTVQWWDVATGMELRSWNFFTDEEQAGADGRKTRTQVHACNLTSNGTYLIADMAISEEILVGGPVKSIGGTIVIYDTEHKRKLWSANAGGVCFSRDSKRMAITTGVDSAEIRDMQTGKVLGKPPIAGLLSKALGISAIALSPDGQLLAVASGDAQILLWKVEGPKEIRRLTAHPGRNKLSFANCLTFTPDGKTLAVGMDSDLQFYDVASLKEVNPRPGLSGSVDYVAFSADGKQLTAANTAGSTISTEVVRWDVVTWKESRTTSIFMPHFSDVGVPSTEHTLYAGKTSDKRFQFFDMTNGKMLGRLSMLPKGAPTLGYFSPGGSYYLLDGEDENGQNAVHLYEVPSGTLLCRVPSIAEDYESKMVVAFSADNRLMAISAEEGGKIHVIETKTGKVLHRFYQEGDAYLAATNLVFSSNGKKLACWSGMYGTIRIWDITTGKLRLKYKDPVFRGSMQLAFSPDGRTLAFGYRFIRILELETANVRQILSGHEGLIRSLAFSPDGRLLASGSTDTTVLIWDVWGR